MGYDERLVLEYLPWAKNLARAYTLKLPTHLDHEDLQSAGIFGYFRAAVRFEPSRGASFCGYCSVRIRWAILDELRRWDWAPRSVHRLHRKIACVTACLTEKLEREPTARELSAALGIAPSELAACQTLSQPHQVVSLDETPENLGEEWLPLAERLADPQAVPPDEAILAKEDWWLARRALGTLPKTEAMILVMHYQQNVPLREVARTLAVTPSRVSQLHHQALARLKQAVRRAHSCGGR